MSEDGRTKAMSVYVCFDESSVLIRCHSVIASKLNFYISQVFNGKGGDRPDAPNVLILFTDGQATDKEGKQYQVQQAKKLKDDGVKVITVAMGVKKTVDRFRDKLSEMASKASDSAAPLMFESEFQYLDMIANKLVKEVCDPSLAV